MADAAVTTADVIAVIPTHRPEEDALLALLATLGRQGVTTLVVDDASPCTSDATLRRARAVAAGLVVHEQNAGIARSLNDGLAFALSSGAAWLLTVDQDSTLPEDYISRLLVARDEAVAVLGVHLVGAVAAGSVDDAAGGVSYRVREVRGLATTPEVIQTGTLWSVPALHAIGGFDESLGIDAVDAAACVRLRAAGRRILLAPDLSLGHRIGASRQVLVAGRSVTATGHSPERRRTIVRNRLRLAPEEFAQSPVHAFRTLRRVVVGTVLAVTVEEDRWAKAKASLAGLLPRRTG